MSRTHTSDRPVFVVGTQRSGSTLLRLMLDAHPDLAIGPETAMLRQIRDAAARLAEGDPNRGVDDTHRLDAEEVEQLLAPGWAAALRLHADREGAARWGDKTPVHRYHGERLQRCFPEAQMIAIVRHPAAVAGSLERWGYEGSKMAKDWASSVRHHRADAARFGPGAFRLVRYEDLLSDPRSTMAGLLSFLGLPWNEAVMHHERGARSGATTDGGTVLSEAVDPARATAWTTGMEAEDLRSLVANVADEAALLGYTDDLAAPVAPLPDSDLSSPPAVAPPRRALSTFAARSRLGRVLANNGAAGTARKAVEVVRRDGLGATLRRLRD